LVDSPRQFRSLQRAGCITADKAAAAQMNAKNARLSSNIAQPLISNGIVISFFL
jgi:hypothetical protein